MMWQDAPRFVGVARFDCLYWWMAGISLSDLTFGEQEYSEDPILGEQMNITRSITMMPVSPKRK